MLKRLLLATCALVFSAQLLAADNPRVLLTTSMGEIELELDAGKAPISVENFLAYVEDGHYDGTQFHRVIPDFMIQGGGFDKDMQQKRTRAPIRNEANNGLKNLRGSIAMARTQAVDSATRQFYFNLTDNNNLNANAGAGYTVFGQVVQGMNVLDKLAQVQTGYSSILRANDVPTSPIILKKVVLLAEK